MRPPAAEPARRRGWLVSVLVGVIVLASVVLTGAALRPDHLSKAADKPMVRAERSGLTLGTRALTGRVALVASTAGLRWRILGVTGWRTATTRTLTPTLDTTRIADGAYRLELRTGDGRSTTQVLSVRNTTPLPSSPLANASLGLSTASSDGRAVVAAFRRRSYRPGDVAVLELGGRYRALRIDLLHVGPERTVTCGNETINGIRVGKPLRAVNPGRSLRIRIGPWESGMYAARLTGDGKVGFAPFVLRPGRLGEHPVAVVQPTNTWQAYNYRCANGDGVPDTWYYTASHTTVDVSRPYLDRGVPPHFRQYDLGFLHWLAEHDKHVDMLAQEDLERLTGDRLARLYHLIIFPGHHEYVTEAEYDAVQRYRDLGGNLAFLSANNFFYRVDRHGEAITRIGRWRDLGRPEAALVGIQYFYWNEGRYRSRQYTVVGVRQAPWLFAGTGLRDGDRLGWFGIEADDRTPASPRSVAVLATMRNVFGTGRPAEMTYYETARGARVFAAGAFTLAGSQARRWTISRILENVWDRLAGEREAFRNR